MPELPEVETVVKELKKGICNRTLVDVWTDAPKLIKKPSSSSLFKRRIKGKKIEGIERRGKNILFRLSQKKTMLVHQKMTGHFLIGKWKRKGSKWEAVGKGPISEDPMNKYLHLIFWLDNGEMLALSDLRKFAKVELWDSLDLGESEYFKSLGPEPLADSFNFKSFKKVLEGKRGKIKQILLDQSVIAGIGNIYSDEVLFTAKIHPLRDVSKLSVAENKNLFRAIKKILTLAVKLQGDSFSDFRRPSGEKGYYDKVRIVYRRAGEKCPRCQRIIERIKVGGRSAHFCPGCQRI
jgi:formamidopyrimidine-DNA glycosylase